MVLKTISPGCGVRASLMLFYNLLEVRLEQMESGVLDANLIPMNKVTQFPEAKLILSRKYT